MDYLGRWSSWADLPPPLPPTHPPLRLQGLRIALIPLSLPSPTYPKTSPRNCWAWRASSQAVSWNPSLKDRSWPSGACQKPPFITLLGRTVWGVRSWEGFSESGLRGSVDGSRVACSRYVWSELFISAGPQWALLDEGDRGEEGGWILLPRHFLSPLLRLCSLLFLPLILAPITISVSCQPFKAMYFIYIRHSLGPSRYLRNCIYVSRFEILRFLEKYFWIKRPSWSFWSLCLILLFQSLARISRLKANRKLRTADQSHMSFSMLCFIPLKILCSMLDTSNTQSVGESRWSKPWDQLGQWRWACF